jgi:Holliday junction resolvase RusA-like endonuclease
MVKRITFEILGNPKAQQRHRTYTKGKDGRPLPFARNVDPSATDKDDLLAQIMQHRPEVPWAGPVSLTVYWFLPRPRSHYHTGKHAGELRPDAPVHCATKPDIDNLEKLLTDAMNGVFYQDDAQIVRVIKDKLYCPAAERPRTEVTLEKL